MSEKKYLPDYVESYEELKDIFEGFHIDSNKTRFYIDADYTEPKAFVIYQDDFGDYVVYKMKADGSRALRYKGPDEKYAVNEYYQKFLEEIRNRPEFAKKLLRPQNTIRRYDGANSRNKKQSKITKYSIIAAVICTLLLGQGYRLFRNYIHRKDGYYITNEKPFYRRGNKMYYYSDIYDDWYYYGYYDDFDDYYDDYQYYDEYTYNEDYTDFSYSDSYYSYDDDDSFWDSDSGWSDSDSWDSWDSSGSDWDSDW